MTPIPSDPARGLASLRILVVDDNADAAESLAMLLRIWGHAADTAADGPAALVAVARDKMDVVILDIGMPGMSGHDVARRLLADRSAESPRIIALSGHGGEEARRKSEDAVIQMHLVKPVDPNVLLEILAGIRPRF